jgi:hypothetical protein
VVRPRAFGPDSVVFDGGVDQRGKHDRAPSDPRALRVDDPMAGLAQFLGQALELMAANRGLFDVLINGYDADWFKDQMQGLITGPGEPLGMTWMTAVSFCRAEGLADTTPGTLASRPVIPAASFALVTGSAVTSRGPLQPGPKWSLTRS